jgi:hypothetical protein
MKHLLTIILITIFITQKGIIDTDQLPYAFLFMNTQPVFAGDTFEYPSMISSNSVTTNASSGAVSITTNWNRRKPNQQLTVTALKAQPDGDGTQFENQFNVLFTVKNIGSLPSKPTTAIISVMGATPQRRQVYISSLATGAETNFEVSGYQLKTNTAKVTVRIAGRSRSVLYQKPLTGGTGQTPVDVYVQPYLKLTVPEQVNFAPPMQIGHNTVRDSLNIKCNTSYRVDIYDNNITNWHLTEWNGSNFLSHRLTDSLHVLNPAQRKDVTANTPSLLLTGNISGQNRDSGQSFELIFDQSLHYSDIVLSPGESYHLQLTFIAYATL